jgi:hypothetical protein
MNSLQLESINAQLGGFVIIDGDNEVDKALVGAPLTLSVYCQYSHWKLQSKMCN